MDVGVCINPNHAQSPTGEGFLDACDGSSRRRVVAAQHNREFVFFQYITDEIRGALEYLVNRVDVSGIGEALFSFERVVFVLDSPLLEVDDSIGRAATRCLFLDRGLLQELDAFSGATTS